ncbi:LOW QUALITY PROTEIN: hypothetical protein Smp_007780 [Schistosoma mansoni]|uniref:hypothetical protein n=1 Tax=Schistosoma mansoni TaxID=6183 RepID=UPI00022DC876|nr:LOW QUALITY PROTEIN: hypothetical protein Smp_007780 [Schistosoma mansoni]|eukprot:XP_018653958.1 LOW QUALITY PROTEIN: hypothetical protein Smp_007780 [Schistosoma mansoni]
MVSHNAAFKGDIVYYLHKPTKSAYIGSVIMSDSHPARNNTEVTHDKCESEYTVKVDWRTFGFKSDSSSIPLNLKPDEVHFLDRSYMPGEVVQNLETKMVGTISNVRMTAHAEILDHQKVMFDIQCDHLRSVYPWTTYVDENYVIWNSWLGRVSGCRLMAIVRFLDGARLLVGDNCLECFESFLSVPDEYMNNNYEGVWLVGDALMTDQDEFNRNCVISKNELGKSIVESSSVTNLKSSGLIAGEKMPSRTTPFWAQVNLFASQRRRRRVTVDPRHRIPRTDIFHWAHRFHRSTPSFTPYIDISADVSDHDGDPHDDEDDTLERTKHQSQIQDQNDQQHKQIDHMKESNHQLIKLTCKRISCDNSDLINKSVLKPVENTTKIDLSLKSTGEAVPSPQPTPITATLTSCTTSTTANATKDANDTNTNENSILSPVDIISSDAAVNKSTTNTTLPSYQINIVDGDDPNHDDSTHVEEKRERFCKKTKLSKHSRRLRVLRRQAEYIQEKRAIHLRAGDWVPVRIYATNSVYDIKWIDGSVSKGVTSDKILSFGGHTEHLFPGFLVSLKSGKNNLGFLDLYINNLYVL